MNTEQTRLGDGEMKDAVRGTGLRLKGTNWGIRVNFPDELTDDELLKTFAAVPEEAYVMPMGSGVVLDFHSRPCSENFITTLMREVIWPKKLKVLAWLTTDEDSSKRLEDAGFRITGPMREHNSAASPGESKNLIVNNSLRSGQREEYGGDVILVGHLNDGAELCAGGSAFVFGRLKGLVHAGCSGTEGICVTAASFEARQLRIGDKLCDQFGADMKWWKKPVIITLEGDGLLFREWTYQ